MGSYKGMILRYLDIDGDGTGVKNANVNGSVTPVTFKLQPGEGQAMAIHRLIIHIEDVGQLRVDHYGTLGAKLTNGILLQVRSADDDSVLLDLLDGVKLDSNHEWSRLCYDMFPHDYGSPTDFAIAYRLSFDRFGGPLVLTADEYLCVVIQDNVTGLLEHYFMAQGEYRN